MKMKVKDVFRKDKRIDDHLRSKRRIDDLCLWGMLLLEFLMLICYMVIKINYYSKIKFKFVLPLIVGIGILGVCICLVNIKHEDLHKSKLESFHAECKIFKNCTVVLKNKRFTKKEFIEGLEYPHKCSSKYLLAIFIIITIFYTAIIGTLLKKESIEFVLILYIAIALSFLTGYLYSKRISVVDRVYVEILNNKFEQINIPGEIIGIEMILKYNNIKDNIYIPWSTSNNDDVDGANGMRIYYE